MLRRSPGLGRLTTVRFASQFGDGLFQAALGGALLFNPKRETDPIEIAAGFAAVLLTGGPQTPLLLLALAAVGVSRFVLAGVSASLPNVVRQSWLVSTHSVLATAGDGVSAAGAGTAVALLGVLGEGDRGSGLTVAIASVGSAIGALAAVGFAAHRLGPTGDLADAGPTG